MKENLLIILGVLLLFIVSAYIRTRYRLSNGFNFWSSVIAVAVFTAMLVNDIFFRDMFKNESLQTSIMLLLAYVVLIGYLSFKGFKSFKQMRK